MALGAKLLRSSGMNVLDLSAKTLAVLVTTPALIHGLGKDQYGVWILVMAMVAYFLIADLGLMFSATRFLAIAVGKKDLESQASIHHVCLRYYRMAAAVVAVLAVCMLPLLPWLADNHGHKGELQIAFSIAACSVVARLCFRLPAILLRAHVRYDLLAVASIARTVIHAAGLLIVIREGGGIVAIASLHASCEALELVLQRLLANRLGISSTSFRYQPEQTGLRTELFRFSRLIFLGDLGNSLRLQFTPLMIPKLQGIEALPDFSIGTRLISILEDLVNAVCGGQVLSAFGQIHGSEDKSNLRQQFLRMVHVTAGFSWAATAGVVMVADAFLMRWVGPELQEAHNVLFILAGAYAFHFSQYPAYNLMHTIGKTSWIAGVCVCGGVFSALLSLILGLHFGLVGIVSGVAVEMVISRGFIVSWLASRCSDLGFWDYFLRHILFSGLKASALPCLVGFLLRPMLSPDYSRILLFIAAYGLCFGVSFLFFVLDRDGRKMLRRQFGF
jgi:O-antigen/teichoic acid export membrane protein